MRVVRAFRKLIPYLMISVILIAAGFIVYGKAQQAHEISYSTYNVKENGCKALYLLTEEMGYHTSRHEKPAALFPQNTTMVIINPDDRYLNKLELKLMKDWILEGNNLIVLGHETLFKNYFSDFMQNPTNVYLGTLSVTESKLNEGSFTYVWNFNQFTNEQLKRYKPAVDFIELLERAGNRNVAFNEYYHGIGKGKTSGLALMSLAVQLALLQLIIAIVLLLLSQSKRFGIPVQVHEIIKRQENEKVFALSNLFIKARANSVVLEIVQEKFNRELSKYLGLPQGVENEELIRAAEKDATLNKHHAAAVMQDSVDYINKKGKSNKELAGMIRRLDEIRKVMRQ